MSRPELLRAPAQPATIDPLLAVEGLRVEIPTRRGIVRAVRGVSFGVRPGETFALVGESGSGKTMTCRAIVRLAAKRAKAIEAGEEAIRAEHELDEVALRDAEPAQAPRRWRRARDIVDDIEARASDPQWGRNSRSRKGPRRASSGQSSRRLARRVRKGWQKKSAHSQRRLGHGRIRCQTRARKARRRPLKGLRCECR